MKLCPKCQKQFSDDANFCPVDAARLTPLEAQSVGQDSLTSRFELGQKLGGSRTGSVQRAVDKTTGKPCVVKLIAPAVVALPGVAQRLERELKQLERVKSVGVCQVLTSGKRGEENWVATELLDGAQTLAEAITARGPLPLEEAASLVELIGEALIEAAQVGVVHRDLAPKNILFAGSDIKLINFSLPVPATEKVAGVPEFVAPEQVEGRPVDQRSNLYSLGALYYYVLTGQTIFAGEPAAVLAQHTNGTIKPPSQLITISAPLEAVIMRALDRSPTKRFLTVRQFVDEVQRVGHGEVIELKPSMVAAKASSRPKAELVQTLLGVKGLGGMLPIASAPTVNPQPAVAGLPGVTPAPTPTPVVPAAPVVPASAPVAAAPLSGPPAMPPPLDTAGVAAVSAALHQTANGGSGIAASVAVPPQAQPAAAPAPAPAPEPAKSPWAPPPSNAPIATAATEATPSIQTPAAPAPTAPVPAAPVVAAPVVAAPVVAAPAAAAAAAPAGKRKAGDDKDNKGKFRETMWFKKGELDAQAAQAAAEERARTGKDVATDKADSKSIDERYNDDGTITRGDKEKYSLRTGGTQMLPAIKDGAKASMSLNKVSEDELIGEMKGLPKWLLAALIIGGIALVGVIIAFMT